MVNETVEGKSHKAVSQSWLKATISSGRMTRENTYDHAPHHWFWRESMLCSRCQARFNWERRQKIQWTNEKWKLEAITWSRPQKLESCCDHVRFFLISWETVTRQFRKSPKNMVIVNVTTVNFWRPKNHSVLKLICHYWGYDFVSYCYLFVLDCCLVEDEIESNR